MGTLTNHAFSGTVSWHLWCSDPSISLRNENARNCLKSSSQLIVCNITIYHRCNLMLLVVVSTLLYLHQPQWFSLLFHRKSSSWHSGISPQWSQHRFGKKPRVKQHRKTHWNLWKHVWRDGWWTQIQFCTTWDSFKHCKYIIESVHYQLVLGIWWSLSINSIFEQLLLIRKMPYWWHLASLRSRLIWSKIGISPSVHSSRNRGMLVQ